MENDGRVFRLCRDSRCRIMGVESLSSIQFSSVNLESCRRKEAWESRKDSRQETWGGNFFSLSRLYKVQAFYAGGDSNWLRYYMYVLCISPCGLDLEYEDSVGKEKVKLIDIHEYKDQRFPSSLFRWRVWREDGLCSSGWKGIRARLYWPSLQWNVRKYTLKPILFL